MFIGSSGTDVHRFEWFGSELEWFGSETFVIDQAAVVGLRKTPGDVLGLPLDPDRRQMRGFGREPGATMSRA